MDITKRTIMIFPQFQNMSCIDKLREKYDPLFDKVRPHVTLVFPFESSYSSHEINAILKRGLRDISAFNVTVQGLSAAGVWLSLDIVEGIQELAQIHKTLYENEFSDFKPLWLHEYVPHITVGQFNTHEELLKVFELEGNLSESFSCLVDTISVEIIGENDESIIELEHPLVRIV